VASLAAGCARPLPVFAQGKYPDRPIRLMVPFSAGGVVDAVGGNGPIAVKPHLGTIVVENQGGAGGTIATGEVARAQPDGYTALLANTSIMVLNPAIMPKVPYDPVKDFAPVSILAISASGIMIHPSVPAKTLQEFVAYARPMRASCRTARWRRHHDAARRRAVQADDRAPEITHVPYRGAAPSIPTSCAAKSRWRPSTVTGQLVELHRTGKIRILAVTSPDRLKGVPEIRPRSRKTCRA